MTWFRRPGARPRGRSRADAADYVARRAQRLPPVPDLMLQWIALSAQLNHLCHSFGWIWRKNDTRRSVPVGMPAVASSPLSFGGSCAEVTLRDGVSTTASRRDRATSPRSPRATSPTRAGHVVVGGGLHVPSWPADDRLADRLSVAGSETTPPTQRSRTRPSSAAQPPRPTPAQALSPSVVTTCTSQVTHIKDFDYGN